MADSTNGGGDARPATLPVTHEREWVGGIVSPPFFITDTPDAWRPKMVLWVELPEGLVVGTDVLARGEEKNALGRVLGQTMQAPMLGEARRPTRIRVCNEELAREVRAVVGDLVTVTVAPTPELDEVVEAMIESWPHEDDDDESYLEDGRVSADLVADLFGAASLLYTVAPWQRVDDDQVLRLDIPKLGVEAACVSIIGALGESLGFIIFPSLEGYEDFVVAAADLPRTRGRRVDLGTSWISLCFEGGTDLPPRMRREALQHGWEPASADAYPRVTHVERDGAVRPLSEHDLRIAAACARSLAAFFVKHGNPLEKAAIEPICESYVDDRDLAVRFTVPYEAHDEFHVGEPDDCGHHASSPGARVGRNAPCPCGSGRKYKKCCLARDEAHSHQDHELAANHEMDGCLVRDIMTFAAERFGHEWFRFFRRFDLDDEDMAVGLLASWSVFHRVVQGRALTDWYLDECGRSLSATEREWLRAQRSAWLSVWEVCEVRPGEGLTIHDLLSGETRAVREVSGSRMLVKRDTILARVVDWHGMSLICGMHPRVLPPSEAAEVVRRARAKLRCQGPAAIERLRDEAFGRYLISRWDEAFHDFALHWSTPPKLCNTDGDPLLLTTDHFDVAPAAHAELCSRLATMQGVQPPDQDDEDGSYVFTRPGKAKHGSLEDVMIGRAWISDDGLHAETNSRKRADALRATLEKACGNLISHRSREHVDPAKLMLEKRKGKGEKEETSDLLPPAEAQQFVLAYKERHYAGWIDAALPALAGRTPREAVRTARGRAEVDVLLKDMENHEQRLSAGERFDFSALRRELGLNA